MSLLTASAQAASAGVGTLIDAAEAPHNVSSNAATEVINRAIHFISPPPE